MKKYNPVEIRFIDLYNTDIITESNLLTDGFNEYSTFFSE